MMETWFIILVSLCFILLIRAVFSLVQPSTNITNPIPPGSPNPQNSSRQQRHWPTNSKVKTLFSFSALSRSIALEMSSESMEMEEKIWSVKEVLERSLLFHDLTRGDDKMYFNHCFAGTAQVDRVTHYERKYEEYQYVYPRFYAIVEFNTRADAHNVLHKYNGQLHWPGCERRFRMEWATSSSYPKPEGEGPLNEEDPDYTTLHISNLDPDVDISLLRTHLGQLGTIVNIKISPKEKRGSIQYTYRSFAVESAECFDGIRFGRLPLSLKVNGHSPTKQLQSLSQMINFYHLEKSHDEPDSKKARVESPSDDGYEYTLADAEADYYARLDMDYIYYKD